jgi:hypothetical protein
MDHVEWANDMAQRADDAHANALATNHHDAENKMRWHELAMHNAKHARDMHARLGNFQEANRLHNIATQNLMHLANHYVSQGKHEDAADLLADEHPAQAARWYHAAALAEEKDLHRKLALLHKAEGYHSYTRVLNAGKGLGDTETENKRDVNLTNIHGNIIQTNTALQHMNTESSAIAKHAKAKINSHLWLAQHFTRLNDHDGAQRQRDAAIQQHKDISNYDAESYRKNKAWHDAQLR